jgi:hypothetical protein
MNLALRQHRLSVTLGVSCLGDGDSGGALPYCDRQAWVAMDDVSTRKRRGPQDLVARSQGV